MANLYDFDENKKAAGWGILKPGATTSGGSNPLAFATSLNPKPRGPVAVAPQGSQTFNTSTPGADSGVIGGGGGGGGGAANAAAKASSQKANEATARLVEQQRSLIDAFGVQRDTKLGGITQGYEGADSLLLKNYGTALTGLMGNKSQNEMAEADASFSNIANAARERQSISDQASSQGAGETDLLRAQLQSLRNYSSNQGEVNRSFHDTLQSINNSLSSLNSDTASSRVNIFNQAEADRESAWANYANQTSDAWTQIMNIEGANNNVDSDYSTAYNRLHADAGSKAAEAVKNSYKKAVVPAGHTDWAGKGAKEERALTSTNRATAVNLGGPTKRPEGATLRKWN